jgi:subtilisin family serine protease
VSIASIDTGIWPQEELSHWERYRVVQSEPLDDSHGHGTHQAGAIGAKRDGGANIGAAFGARHVSINHGQNRVYDVSSWRVHLAIEVAAAQGARVVSLSLGDAQSSELSADAIRSYFYDTPGISFVAASGSLGLPNIAFPADMPETIAVGAINWPSGEVFVCSHHGPELDVVAYHGQITSYNPIGDAGNFFAVASNTSHANAKWRRGWPSCSRSSLVSPRCRSSIVCVALRLTLGISGMTTIRDMVGSTLTECSAGKNGT